MTHAEHHEDVMKSLKKLGPDAMTLLDAAWLVRYHRKEIGIMAKFTQDTIGAIRGLSRDHDQELKWSDSNFLKLNIDIDGYDIDLTLS